MHVGEKDGTGRLLVEQELNPALNEFRAGAPVPRWRNYTPWELLGPGLQPQAGGVSYLLSFGLVTTPLPVVGPDAHASPT